VDGIVKSVSGEVFRLPVIYIVLGRIEDTKCLPIVEKIRMYGVIYKRTLVLYLLNSLKGVIVLLIKFYSVADGFFFGGVSPSISHPKSGQQTSAAAISNSIRLPRFFISVVLLCIL